LIKKTLVLMPHEGYGEMCCTLPSKYFLKKITQNVLNTKHFVYFCTLNLNNNQLFVD